MFTESKKNTMTSISLWQIILSIVGALLLLLLLLLCLICRTDFFKRTAEELQKEDKVREEFEQNAEAAETEEESTLIHSST